MTHGAPAADAGYWDSEIREARAGATDAAWYRYMDEVYAGLVGSVPGPAQGPSLKTDLYEEARGRAAPLRHLPEPRFGIDISAEVVAAARENMRRQGVACELLVADVRALPFAAGSVRCILSGSTLDHFERRDDLIAGLRELARVLAPGGSLALTLDNPHNPVLWLRRRAERLSAHRLRPYFVGQTLTRAEAEAELEAIGLELRQSRAVAHAPRDPAMRLMRWSGTQSRLSDRIGRALRRFELLERAPTRWRTGYYLAFEAVKPGGPADVSTAAGSPP